MIFGVFNLLLMRESASDRIARGTLIQGYLKDGSRLQKSKSRFPFHEVYMPQWKQFQMQVDSCISAEVYYGKLKKRRRNTAKLKETNLLTLL
jgi:hypothetical protein